MKKLTDKEKERRRFERFITKNVKVFWQACQSMKSLSNSIDRMCKVCKLEKLDKGDGWHGNERKDTSKKIRKNK